MRETCKSQNINPIYLTLVHLQYQSDNKCLSKIVSEYDQEIPQSQTADNPVAPRGRAAQPSRDTRRQIKQSNQLLV